MRRALFLSLLLAACGDRPATPAPATFPAAAEQLISGFVSGDTPASTDYHKLFAYFVESWETYKRPSGTGSNVPGFASRHGQDVDALEGFARTAPLIAAWLHGGRASEVVISNGERINLIDMIATGVSRGTDPSDPGYWGDIGDLDQRIVEASDIALALWLSRATVWSRFSVEQRQRVLSWLAQVDGKIVPDNNWHLFVTLIDLVRIDLGGSAPMASAREHYLRFKSFYRGDGWFSDGPEETYDYYNGWGIHYQLFWLKQIAPTWDRAFIDAAEAQFVATYRYLVGPRGIPMMGRSICYRMAVPAPLILSSASDRSAISQGEARRGLDAVWTYFIQNRGLTEGIVTQGYCGPDPRVVDDYSGPSSCLWGLRSLIAAFILPEGAAFWSQPAGKFPVDTASYSISVPTTGWQIIGDRSTATITIVQADSLPERETRLISYGFVRRMATKLRGRPFRPDNYNAKYRRGQYSSKDPFCGCR